MQILPEITIFFLGILEHPDPSDGLKGPFDQWSVHCGPTHSSASQRDFRQDKKEGDWDWLCTCTLGSNH